MREDKVQKDYYLMGLVVSVIVTLLVDAMIKTGSVIASFTLLMVVSWLYIHWLDSNRDRQDDLHSEIAKLAIKSEEYYRKHGNHLDYEVSSLIQDLKTTEADFSLALADAWASGVLEINDERDYLELQVVKYHPFHATFKNRENDSAIDLSGVKVSFPKERARKIYEINKEYIAELKSTNK